MSVSPSSINPDEVRSKEIWTHKGYVDTFLRIWKNRPEQKTDARGNKIPEKGLSSAKNRLIHGEVITTNDKKAKHTNKKHKGKYIVRDGRITSLTGYKNGTPYKKCSASVKAYISWVLINKWDSYYKVQVKQTLINKEKEQGDLLIKTSKLTSSLANHKIYYEKKLEEKDLEIKHLKENEINLRRNFKELKLKVNAVVQENDYQKKYFDVLDSVKELKTENEKYKKSFHEAMREKIDIKNIQLERVKLYEKYKILEIENEKYKKLYDADPDEMGCDKDRRLRNIDFYIEKLKKTYALCKIRKEENEKLQEHIKELVADDVNEIKIEKLNKQIENWKAKWVKHMME